MHFVCPVDDSTRAQVLGVLHVLGRGNNCFADISQMSLMSRQTAEKAFRDFCKHFSANLYDAWVHLPKGEDLVEVEKKFRERGFPGAVGSTGCMRVARGRCPCLLYTSPSPRDQRGSRMPSSA